VFFSLRIIIIFIICTCYEKKKNRLEIFLTNQVWHVELCSCLSQPVLWVPDHPLHWSVRCIQGYSAYPKNLHALSAVYCRDWLRNRCSETVSPPICARIISFPWVATWCHSLHRNCGSLLHRCKTAQLIAWHRFHHFMNVRYATGIFYLMHVESLIGTCVSHQTSSALLLQGESSPSPNFLLVTVDQIRLFSDDMRLFYEEVFLPKVWKPMLALFKNSLKKIQPTTRGQNLKKKKKKPFR